jgi:CelD/BcsL family acetyltransferase involved in cellulose biosynthesis
VIVELIDNSARFDAMQTEWNELLGASSAESPFLTWEWLNAWWTHLKAGRRLALLTVRDEGRGSPLMAVAPLCASRGRVPLLWRWELLGTGFAGSDYLDAIVRRGAEGEALSRVADYVRSQRMTLHLDHLSPCAALSRLTPMLSESGWSFRQASHGVCPYIGLSGHSWDSFLATIGPAHRATTRRRLRTLEKKFAMRFEQVTDDRERELALTQLFAFHRERWGDRGTAFHTHALRAFHLDLTHRAKAAGWLRLYTLHLNEDLAAVMYGFSHRGRFYFYQHGYDSRFQAHGVGRAVLDLSIRAAIGEGLEEFDLLYGTESYKSAWTDQARSLTRIDLFPPHFSGRIHQRAVDTERSLRALARRVVPTHVPQTH